MSGQQQHIMGPAFAPTTEGYPQYPMNHVTMSQASPPIFAPAGMPQQNIHNSQSPPFNGSSPATSPPYGHAHFYYLGHHHEETNDFVLYPPGSFAPQSSSITSGPISDHTSSPPMMTTPPHFTNAPMYQQQPIPYTTAPGQPPNVARVDSLNSFLDDIFPGVPRGAAGMATAESYTEIPEQIPRAMPQSEIDIMERNLRRSLTATFTSRPSFIKKYIHPSSEYAAIANTRTGFSTRFQGSRRRARMRRSKPDSRMRMNASRQNMTTADRAFGSALARRQSWRAWIQS